MSPELSAPELSVPGIVWNCLAEDMAKLGISKYQEFDKAVKGVAEDMGNAMKNMKDKDSQINLKRKLLQEMKLGGRRN